MRIRSLTPADVYSAIQAQNMEVSAGSVGQPPTDTDEAFQFTLVSKGRLSTPEEFGRIIIKSLPGGEYLRLRDIATIDLGSATYNTTSTINGKETAAIAIYQLPGSNSLDVAKAVKAKMMDLSRYFPNDVQYKVVLDTTQFVSDAGHSYFLTKFQGDDYSLSDHTGFAYCDICRDEVDGIFYQYAYSFRPCFGNSYRGGRCDRSGRKFDPAYRYGKV